MEGSIQDLIIAAAGIFLISLAVEAWARRRARKESR